MVCAICRWPLDHNDTGDETPTFLPCAHGFHAICIEDYRKDCAGACREFKCPICKQSPEDMLQLEDALTQVNTEMPIVVGPIDVDDSPQASRAPSTEKLEELDAVLPPPATKTNECQEQGRSKTQSSD